MPAKRAGTLSAARRQDDSFPIAVTLPHYGSSQGFDLDKLNSAMDAVLAAQSEAAGRYALVHTHGWSATDAVDYARAATHCIEYNIDPNQIAHR
jgi:hypothetical protein